MGGRGRRLPRALEAKDFLDVLHHDGWVLVPGSKHLALTHPTKLGKVNIDEKWCHVKPGSWVFRSVLRQASLTREQFEEFYWASR